MANNLKDKGYRDRATTFEWDVNGERVITTSNAVDYEKAREAAALGWAMTQPPPLVMAEMAEMDL